MKRIAAFVFAFLAVCYFQIADSDAQFVRECRSYGFCVPGGAPTGTPVSNGCISTAGTSITFTAQGTGTANANRISVVSINWSSAGSSELTAVTIGGISMTRGNRATSSLLGNNSEIWYVANPSGTSSNIVLTASVALTGVTIEVYSLIGYRSVVATTAGTTSVSQTYNNKQLAIAAGSRATNVSTSLSNMTNDFSSACGLGLWGVHASQPLHGNGTLSSSISPTSSNPEIALVVWTTAPLAACTESTAFFARATGLDALHINAYNAFICGMVADGLWGKFDWLYLFATQDSATAVLNLVSTSYNGSIGLGTPFTVDRGFQGAAISNRQIDTTFNPATASSPKFTQNDAHIAAWNLTNIADANAIMGLQVSDGSHQIVIYPKFNGDSKAYFRLNQSTGAGSTSTISDSTGFYVGVRRSSSAVEGYKDGASIFTGTDASQALTNIGNIVILGSHCVGCSGDFASSAYQAAAASGGSQLSAANVTAYNARIRTYMTAVGIP